jgi:hypothetical protein
MLSPADTKDNSTKNLNNFIQNTILFKIQNHVGESRVTSIQKYAVCFQAIPAYENIDASNSPHKERSQA